MDPYFAPPSRDDQAEWQWQQREEAVEREQERRREAAERTYDE